MNLFTNFSNFQTTKWELSDKLHLSTVGAKDNQCSLILSLFFSFYKSPNFEIKHLIILSLFSRKILSYSLVILSLDDLYIFAATSKLLIKIFFEIPFLSSQ